MPASLRPLVPIGLIRADGCHVNDHLHSFFFSSRRRHTRSLCDWSSDVCSSDLRAKPVDLKLASLGSVSGRVVNYDGQTPVGGASITFAGSIVFLNGITTKPDGSFLIPSMEIGRASCRERV